MLRKYQVPAFDLIIILINLFFKRKHCVLYFLTSRSLNDKDKLHTDKRGKDHTNHNNNDKQRDTEDQTKSWLEPFLE